METTSYNKIDAAESDYLYTDNSQIPNSGKGLFTAIPIYKDEMIAVFHGEILTEIQAETRIAKGDDRYFILLPNGEILGSMQTQCFAKFANDASISTDKRFKNNTKIAFDDNQQVGLIALRKIAAGEEIFCAYGKKYWKKWLLNM